MKGKYDKYMYENHLKGQGKKKNMGIKLDADSLAFCSQSIQLQGSN